MPDLKPCPFCGNTPREVEISCRGVGKVECGKCFAKFTFYAVHSLKDVKEAWNRRAGEEDKHSICGATNLPCIRCNPGGCDNRKEGADNG